MAEKKTITLEVVVDDKGAASVKILTDSIDKLNETRKRSNETAKLSRIQNGKLAKEIEKLANSKRRTIEVIKQEIKLRKQLIDRVATTNEGYLKGAQQVMRLEKELKDLTKTQSAFNASAKLNNKTQKESSDTTKSAQTENGRLAAQIEKLANSKRRTIDVIQQEISLRKQLIQRVATTNEGYLKGTMQVMRLEKELKDLTKTQSAFNASSKLNAKNMGSVRSATGNATGMMVELGRTISDANYGITGMANNLQQLASTFILTTKTSGGVLATLKDLGKSFLGVGGLLVIFSTAITLIERYAMKQREAKSATKDLNDEISKKRGAIENLRIFADIINTSNENTTQHQLALKKLKDEGYDPLIGSVEDFIELKEKEMYMNAVMEVFNEDLVEALRQQKKATDELKIKREELLKLDEEVSPDVVFMTKADIKILEENLAAATQKVKETRAEIKDVRKEFADFLKGNSFLKLILGDDTDVDFVEGIAIGLDEAEEWLAENELRFEDLRKKTQIFDPDDVSVMDEYDPDTDPELQNLLDRYKRMKEADEEYALFKKDLTDRTLDMLQNSFGKETAIAKAAFVAKQIIAAKEIFLEAKKAITFSKIEASKSVAAVEAGRAQTAKVGFPKNVPLLIAYAAQAAAIMSSIKSAFQHTDQAVAEVGVGGGGSSAATIAAPDFNIVGASPTNQLAQTIATAEEQPVRAYVVSDDVTTAQQLDRNIIEGASLG